MALLPVCDYTGRGPLIPLALGVHVAEYGAPMWSCVPPPVVNPGWFGRSWHQK